MSCSHGGKNSPPSARSASNVSATDRVTSPHSAAIFFHAESRAAVASATLCAYAPSAACNSSPSRASISLFLAR